MVQYLVDLGVDPSLQTLDRETAADIARRRGARSIFEFLTQIA
jgi:hypothetical protein